MTPSVSSVSPLRSFLPPALRHSADQSRCLQNQKGDAVAHAAFGDRSPSHITKMVPVVRVSTVDSRNPQVGAPTPLTCSQWATKEV